jgi:glycosyltransferase involved in cell wall biosynthesis
MESKKREIEEDKTLPITLAIMVKDNEDCILGAIESVLPIVREVVILDTGSTDNTVSICEGVGARIYKSGFSDFGSIRTLAAHLSRQDYVFMLDSDERILHSDLPKFKNILNRMREDGVDIIGFPRRRWYDLEMTREVHPDAFPDYQYRLFVNNPEIKYKRRVHEVISGSNKRTESVDFPCIQHFQDSFKSGSRLEDRNALYNKLYEMDIKDGIMHEEKAIHKVDQK